MPRPTSPETLLLTPTPGPITRPTFYPMPVPLPSGTLPYLRILAQGSGAVYPGGGYYPQGKEVTLQARACPNYRFDHWEDALTGSDNPARLTMNGNKTITAVFVWDESATDKGKTSPSGAAGGETNSETKPGTADNSEVIFHLLAENCAPIALLLMVLLGLGSAGLEEIKKG